MDWISLVSDDQLVEIDSKSFNPLIKGVLIFKHSTRCSTSSMSLHRLERNWDLPATIIPAYFLDLIQYRALSNKISEIYKIDHESPQVLVIKNGKCIYTTSHSDINVNDIKSFP